MKIVIIDEFPLMRLGLEKALSIHIEKAKILESESIVHFQELYPQEIPDIIVLGINSNSEKSNHDWIASIKERKPKVSVIIYADNLNSLEASMYLKAGVDGYLTKKDSLIELVNCVNCVVSGKKYLAYDILIQVLTTVDQIKLVKKTPKTDRRLSVREKEVAQYLSNGMKVSDIAKKLERKISTISTIKKNIFEKLRVDSVIKLAHAMAKV